MLARKALAGTAGAPKVYVEDVFSTYLYTGTGSAQTITNNIDLSGKGGLVWIKNRSDITGHRLTDTVRGATKSLESNSTAAEATESTGLTAFSGTGFTIGADADYSTNNNNYVSWAFREAEKFFDVVTYTGNGTDRTISHNLGSVPGCIIVKRTNTTGAWQVYHRSLANTEYLVLNTDAAKATGTTRWNSTTPTSTEFSLGTDSTVNANGGTYVAYLFAHDAGGFGDAGSDNIITCGSYTGNGSATGPTISLGYEPQWVMIKNASAGATRWTITDNMRGFPVTSATSQRILQPYTNEADNTVMYIQPTSTGFNVVDVDGDVNTNGQTYIYIAIRRGPMKTPTTGTSVFGVNARSGTGANATVTGGQIDDAVIIKNRGAAAHNLFASRLTTNRYLLTSSTNAEDAGSTTVLQTNPWDVMDGVKIGTTSTITNASSNTYINYLFRRAPGFFDVVCYTGTGSATTFNHNLGVVPELMIVKARNSASYDWGVFTTTTGAGNVLKLNLTDASTANTFYFNNTAPTSSVFSVGTSAATNGSGTTYVAYLFASLSGVSKVGSYTGNGSSVTVTTNFQPRFILVKRTDSTGDWIVGDSARGLVSADEPALFLNSTNAETTGQDWVDVSSTGFTVNETALSANTNTGTYIYLAIA